MSDDVIEGSPIEDGDINEIINETFISDFRKKGYRRYRGVFMPASHSRFSERLENFEVRNDDVWVMSYPKTGTTWTQEMVWCIANNLDFEKAKEFLPLRFPFVDLSSIFDFSDILANNPDQTMPPFFTDSVTFTDNMPSVRYIKTHLPWQLLPKQIREGEKTPKIIYVCRNAKDTCISYYHHCIIMEGYKGSFDDFCKLFLSDSLCYSPYWPHIKGFWERRAQTNVLFLRYEDMRKDLSSVVRQTADFLEKELSDQQVDTLCDHLSFKSMKENPSVNYEAAVEINRSFGLAPEDGKFMRQGTGGEWKGKMSADQIAEFDAWTNRNTVDAAMDVWNVCTVGS